jgi:UDP-N-acetylglucosamine 2-epimerase
MKIVTIIGARPQFIKAAAVSRAIQDSNKKFSSRGGRSKKRIKETMVHTGQHYDYLMDKVFFEELELRRCDYHLGVGSGPHGKQTGMMLTGLSRSYKMKDLMSSLSMEIQTHIRRCARSIKDAHPRRPCRGGPEVRRHMPEEINRLLTDHLSALLFCPTVQR